MGAAITYLLLDLEGVDTEPDILDDGKKGPWTIFATAECAEQFTRASTARESGMIATWDVQVVKNRAGGARGAARHDAPSPAGACATRFFSPRYRSPFGALLHCRLLARAHARA
eukprot:scaffold11709_cov145-Isochrysis_galbana.AAC.3